MGYPSNSWSDEAYGPEKEKDGDVSVHGVVDESIASPPEVAGSFVKI